MDLLINDRIRTRKIQYFEDFEINRKYDSLGSTFRFNFLFNPDNIEHKEMACIGHYHIVKIQEEGQTLLTGYMLTNAFNDFPETELASVGGYSLPGVLQDCEIPFGEPSFWVSSSKGYAKYILNKSWPLSLQTEGLSLKEMVQKILNPFSLQMVIDASVVTAMDEPYDEVTAREKQSAKSFICELAAQKNIVVTDDEFGRVVFTRPKTSQTPVFHFDKNIPNTGMGLVFNGPAMHSHIRVCQQQDMEEDIPGSENTIENPYVPFVFRPHVTTQKADDASNTPNAARNVLSKELKNLILTIKTDRWQVNGVVWKPGQIVSVTNPKVYLYKKSNWFIEEVHLRRSASRTTAELKCVVPEVYNNADVKYLFAGINLH